MSDCRACCVRLGKYRSWYVVVVVFLPRPHQGLPGQPDDESADPWPRCACGSACCSANLTKSWLGEAKLYLTYQQATEALPPCSCSPRSFGAKTSGAHEAFAKPTLDLLAPASTFLIDKPVAVVRRTAVVVVVIDSRRISISALAKSKKQEARRAKDWGKRCKGSTSEQRGRR